VITHEHDWMLNIGDGDLDIYRRLLPDEGPLLDALEMIPWESFVPELEAYYCPDMGQPARTPLIMLKLEFLRYFFYLSDRAVIARCQTDLLFRWFLQVPIGYRLPDPTSLTRFRGRLGPDGFKRIFDRLITAARDANLVRDRLRLKDATHVIANIAVPTTLGLLAQLRERLIGAIEQIDPEAAQGYRIEGERIRIETENSQDGIKLQRRLELVIDILDWISQQSPPEQEGQQSRWKKLQSLRELAQKIVGDTLHPGRGDRTLSVVDPDARRGKHGEYYDGYLVDAMIDADSQLITGVEVLSANGEEAMDTVNLVKMEQSTHGNQIEQVSIDGIGFHGEMLRQLENPDGLAISVITPVHDFQGTEGLPTSAFELTEDGSCVRCPAGQVSRKAAFKKDKPNSTFFAFCGSICAACKLLSICHPTMKPGSATGRRVTKNEYELEYERARQKAETEEYQSVRREHHAIERKLNEIVRHHGGRRAKYWGHGKVKIQQLMTCFTVNVKRMMKLLKAESCALRIATA
jgi:transposase/phage-related protein